MALSGMERLTLVVILAVVMFIVVFFEMRMMKRKSKEVRRVYQKKDEAYNDILTTRSVMNSLANQGKSTGNAEYLVDRARSAMDRGDYDRCVSLCAQARNELTKPSKGSKVPETISDDDAADSLEKVAENILSKEIPAPDPDSYKGSKLSSASEGNYLGAKFEMSAARADLSRSAKSGADVSEAETLMKQADSAFSGGNYDRALSFAVRARRSLRGEAIGEAIPLRKTPEAQTEGSSSEAEVYDVEEEKTPSGFKCKNCGKLIDPADLFCGNCGARTSEERSCKNCGAKAKPEDTFCRKCGERI